MNLSIRDLFEEILNYDGDNIFSEVLNLWVEENSYETYLGGLSKFVSPDQTLNFPIDDSWELYALSRVLDILTLRFQPNKKADGSEWVGPLLTLADYIKFIEALGLKIVSLAEYKPFYYEIFEAIPGKVNFQVSEIIFPPVMLENLLIKRGGSIITLNPLNFDLETVNDSTIYWAYRRKNRKYEDLSHGWGSNSQWRTSFRFDYDYPDYYLYNAEGEIDLNLPNTNVLDELKEYDLSLNEAIEITVNRHFLTSKKQDNDLFPYNYKYMEKKKVL
jgi:hypothetical protein